MTTFENELKNGKFVCSECIKCNKLVWPPSDLCSNCFAKVRWRQVSTVATLVEFSKKDNTIFCIAEFEGAIRVMGSLETKSEEISIGQELILAKCDYDERERFVFQLK